MRAYNSYDVIGTGSHASDTSTGTADKKTITAPVRANAMLISVKTTDARVTFDGVDPGAGIAPGIIVKAGQQPYLFPFAKTFEFVSDTAGNSEVNVLWLV